MRFHKLEKLEEVPGLEIDVSWSFEPTDISIAGKYSRKPPTAPHAFHPVLAVGGDEMPIFNDVVLARWDLIKRP